MEIPEHRRWMYNRKTPQGNKLLHGFIWGVEDFILAASKLEVFKREGTFRCPCLKCKCLRFHVPDEVRLHLYKKGFQPHYYYWHNHGEIEPPRTYSSFEKLKEDVADSGSSTGGKNKRGRAMQSSFEKLKEDVADSGSSADNFALFFQATERKNKRGRAYGFRSEVAFYSSSEFGSNRSGSQSTATAHNTDEVTQLQQRIAILETQLEEERTRAHRRFSQLESELATLKGYFQQFTSHIHSGHNNSKVVPTTLLRPPTINENDEDDENF